MTCCELAGQQRDEQRSDKIRFSLVRSGSGRRPAEAANLLPDALMLLARLAEPSAAKGTGLSGRRQSALGRRRLAVGSNGM